MATIEPLAAGTHHRQAIATPAAPQWKTSLRAFATDGAGYDAHVTFER